MATIKERLAPVLAFLRRNRWYLIWLLALMLCIIFAGLDNPTGIVLGWAAVTILLLVLFRKWRRPLYFLIFMLATFLGAIFISLIHQEAALRLALWLGGPEATASVAWRTFHVVVSDIMLLGAPPGLFFGFFGFVIFGTVNIVKFVKRRHTADGT